MSPLRFTVDHASEILTLYRYLPFKEALETGKGALVHR